MQMYLFSRRPFPAVNGADDASVVYHEYTHGLSSRLVTDANGFQALNSAQAGAMGEAWSDWYAMDYLVEGGLAPDTAADGDVILDRYVGNLRSEGPRLPGRLRSAPPAPAQCSQAPAATPTATSAGSSAPPRYTPTVRSGARPSGISGPTSVSRPRGASSRAQWSSRRPSRRSSTCAMPSCRRTRLRGAHVPQPDLAGLREPRHGLLRLRASTPGTPLLSRTSRCHRRQAARRARSVGS